MAASSLKFQHGFPTEEKSLQKKQSTFNTGTPQLCETLSSFLGAYIYRTLSNRIKILDQMNLLFISTSCNISTMAATFECLRISIVSYLVSSYCHIRVNETHCER